MKEIDPAIYGSSWFAATMSGSRSRPRLTIDIDVDVCVVGGGLAGLTVAREVAQRGWSVVILETRRIACNASGRNTGFVLPGFAQGMDKIAARIGLDHARELWALSRRGLDYVHRTIRDGKLAGVRDGEGWLAVSKHDEPERIAADVDLLAGSFGANVEVWPVERVRATLKSEQYFQAVSYRDAFLIHPLNYALALANAAEADGARIFEETPALSMDPAGVRKRITTPGARIRAAHVVLAGNTHLGALMPRLAATLLPISTYIITTAPLGERLAGAVTYGGGVSDTDWADNHYRIVGGDRLMLSGRMTTWSGNPKRYVKGLAGDIARLYPQLGPVEIEYAWTGMLGNAVHRMPQIGEMSPGLWVASGFGGHGLNTTAMAGELIARAIVEGDDTWRLFAPYQLVWAGGLFGRAGAQTRYWTNQARDGLARKRDAWPVTLPQFAGAAMVNATMRFLSSIAQRLGAIAASLTGRRAN
ncbi:MAG: FAD-binding oxidoreductase [Rhizobiales bacterium]|nr:FAD-binding oxidoreductase [Hyphomicrobiales bacterium]